MRNGIIDQWKGISPLFLSLTFICLYLFRKIKYVER